MLIRDAIKELSSSLRAAVLGTAGIDHRLLKGELREEKVREAFQRLLPRRYRAVSGVAVNKLGQQSKQQDYLIADAMAASPLVTAGRIGVFPIEVIAGALEIKSVLDLGALETAVHNVASLKQLSAVARRTRMVDLGNGVVGPQWTEAKPLGAVLGLGSPTALPALADRYLQICKELPPADRPNAALVVGAGALMWSGKADGLSVEQAPVAATHLMLCTGSDEDLLLVFYAVVIEFLECYVFPRLPILDYVNAALPELQVERRIVTGGS